MSARQFWIAVLSVLTFLAASSVAQEKNELGGVIGRIFISDQGINASIPDNTIHSGKGLSFGGEICPPLSGNSDFFRVRRGRRDLQPR